MKKNLVHILCLISLQLSAQQDKFTISGNIKDLDAEKMFLFIYDEAYPNGYIRDSIIVTNGAFTYTSSVNKLSYAIIAANIDRIQKKAKGGYYPAKSSTVQLFVFPKADIKLSGRITDFADVYPSGDKTNNEFATLNRTIYPFLNKSVNISVALAKQTVADSTVIKKMKDSAALYDKEVIAIKEKFLKENTSSFAAIWLLEDMMIRSQLSNDAAAAYFKKMDKEKLEGFSYYKGVSKRIEAISATAIGKVVPGISSSNTYDGNPFDLVSLRGKYVVLDFWGTWCGPCISGMPKMKEYLDKYKEKLDIVGVASESDAGERWKRFLKTNQQYQWHQVLSDNKENYITKFNVVAFPTKIIVDPKGVIVDKFVGEDDEIYKKLDEIFK